jgi:adenine deaminase
MSWTSSSVAQVVECVTAHPAQLLGIADSKGFLAPGLDADLVVLDDVGNVHQTWKFGEKVFDLESPVKQEVKKGIQNKDSMKESVRCGERFTVPETRKLVNVTSNGVRVH